MLRSKMIMLLAIVMGLITTYLFYHYMDGFKGAEEAKVELTEAVAASRDIKPNEMIGADMLKQVQIPAEGLFQGAIADPAEALGKYALVGITAGEPILPHRLQEQKAEDVIVARKINTGYRAVSLGVNFVQSVSNLIEPEDYVDIVFTKLGQPELGTVTESSILLSKVRVLAVGRRMIESAEGDEYAEYSSATLELSESDTVKAVNAANDGIITLTLHSRIVPASK